MSYVAEEDPVLRAGIALPLAFPSLFLLAPFTGLRVVELAISERGERIDHRESRRTIRGESSFRV